MLILKQQYQLSLIRKILQRSNKIENLLNHNVKYLLNLTFFQIMDKIPSPWSNKKVKMRKFFLKTFDI